MEKSKIQLGLLKYWEKRRKELINELQFEMLPKSLIKRIIKEENKNTCEICGYSYTDPNNGKGPFEVHHKDGNNNNWKRDNLILLCLNCHWKTDYYRFKNRKHTEETKKKISINNYSKRK